MKVLSEVVLEYTQGTSNKRYAVRVLGDDLGHYQVEGEWGKIGGPQTTQVKLFGRETQTTSLWEANDTARTLWRSKEAKGYRVVS